MSRTPYFFVERFNSYTNKYELQHPIVWNYNHTKQETADLFPYNGCHDLFSIVENNGTGDDFPAMRGIHNGLPKDVSADIKEACDNYCVFSNVRWFTYADMHIYCLEHPEVIDYDAMDAAYYNGEEGTKIEKIMKPNPLNHLKKRVDAFLEVMDEWGWEEDYSQIRIVYWID